jgi:hypothetical protein
MKFHKSALRNLKQKLLFNDIAFIEIEGWLPKKTVMRFFDYGETQMRQLEKEFNLETSKIRARKFYSVKSIINLIEQHKQIKK